jgi:putative transposase
MAQTVFSAYFHIVFSTKNRFSFIPPELEAELFAYIGGIVHGFDARLIAAGGTANHVHLLISVSKNHLVPDLIGAIKRDSSKWIKTKGTKMLTKFAWQDGYAAFTVGHTQIAAVKSYLARQKEHHRETLFEDEMRGFYRKYQIDFDEQYAWD